MKKLLSLVAMFMMALTFNSCGSDNDSDGGLYIYGAHVEVNEQMLKLYDDLTLTYSCPGGDKVIKVDQTTVQSTINSDKKGTIKAELTGHLNASKCDDNTDYTLKFGLGAIAVENGGSTSIKIQVREIVNDGASLKQLMPTFEHSDSQSIH